MRTRTLLICGAVAGPLFTLAWLVEGATRAGYDPLRHPVSGLALGDHGWTQTANFIITGLLTLAFAIGLRRVLRPPGGSTWGPLLIGAFAVGLLGAGIFATDPVSGYPPGTPEALAEYTATGALHDLFSLPVFVCLPAACFVFARRFAGRRRTGWALYSLLSGLAFSAGFVLAGLGFGQTPGLVEVAGLFQRITLTVGWTWITLLAVDLLRAPVPVPAAAVPR